MPLRRSVARFNLYVTNRILGPLGWIGSRNGCGDPRWAENPSSVSNARCFAEPIGFIIALTYGRLSDTFKRGKSMAAILSVRQKTTKRTRRSNCGRSQFWRMTDVNESCGSACVVRTS